MSWFSDQELIYGEPGSTQSLAYRIKAAFRPLAYLRQSIEEDEKWANNLFKAAVWNSDTQFFNNLADGLSMLTSAERSPAFAFVRAYAFLRETNGRLPYRQEVIELTGWIRAAGLKTGKVPNLPLPDYPPGLKEQIRQEIPNLPKQKWSRIYNIHKLKFSSARRGPKPKAPGN
jgi:hypothetical protein